MRLSLESLESLESLQDVSFWQRHGYQLPQFNVREMAIRTKREPVWLHFGAGNLFRALIANLSQRLLNQGDALQGIIAVGGSNNKVIDDIYRRHDNLGIFVRLHADTSREKIVLGSIAESLCMFDTAGEDLRRLQAIVSHPGLQMISLTITEKAYQLQDSAGAYLPAVEEDFSSGPQKTRSYLGRLASLLHCRCRNQAPPLAVVSMDNMARNGEVLENAMLTFAERWEENGHVETAFRRYLRSDRVSFPWSMVDKITPRPDEKIAQILSRDGLEGMTPRSLGGETSGRNSLAAPFVNAEELEYLVIEDAFPNGRPALERAGAMLAPRETVKRAETMKVTTCLNPVHTGLAVFGCLLDFSFIHEEIRDADLRRLAHRIAYREGLPVAIDPGILDPRTFVDELLNVRLPNPYIPDTPQRIAADTSQKLAIRFGWTIKSYCRSEHLALDDLVAIPLVFAAWCRYLLGVDDEGKSFTCSPDPKLESLQRLLSGVRVGKTDGSIKPLHSILADREIFGVDLYAVGLGDRVERYFAQMIAGKGAVRATLRKYLPDRDDADT